METTGGSRASRYPFGIVIVLVGLLARIAAIVAVLLLAPGDIGPFAWLADGAPVPPATPDTAVGIVILALAIGLLVGSVLAVVGLLRRSATGWVLAVVTGGAILAINLGWWASGEPRYLSMAINAVLLLYLNQRDVRAIYGDLA
jgi:hypothetical protein